MSCTRCATVPATPGVTLRSAGTASPEVGVGPISLQGEVPARTRGEQGCIICIAV